MVTVWITDRLGDGPISLRCYDDSKKNLFNNSGNNGHELKNVSCKQTFTPN